MSQPELAVLISPSEIAEIAGVTQAAVANWRRRGTKGFPSPASDGKSGPLYRLDEVRIWLEGRGQFASPDLITELNGVEATLWAAADKLRGSVDPSNYRYLVLTLIFLRHALFAHLHSAERARAWTALFETDDAKLSPTIMSAIAKVENDQPGLAGVIPRVFSSSSIDPRRLRGIIKLVAELPDHRDARSDVVGRIYEYLLSRFAGAEGRSGGEFYTPESVVSLLAEIVEPTSGSVYDPCCGSGGMFVQSARVRRAHGSDAPMKVFGQELNPGTWRVAKMNMALHGIEADLGSGPADTFHKDLHAELKADFIMANPPFNITAWGASELAEDHRWSFGLPPNGNANYAWIQHIWSHLAENGRGGVVLANGSLSSNQVTELTIRRGLIEAGAIEGMVALPSQLFYSTTIPVTLWFLSKPTASAAGSERDRKVLFVDARGLGRKVTRTHRELQPADVEMIASQFRAVRAGTFVTTPGFASQAGLNEIEKADWSLVPSRYVGNGDEDGAEHESFSDLAAEYKLLASRAAELDRELSQSFDGMLK